MSLIKYRIVKQGTGYYIQFNKSTKWLGSENWQWLTYKDSENQTSRQFYLYFDDARVKVSELINGAEDYDVVWTQP